MYRITSFLFIGLLIACNGDKKQRNQVLALQELEEFPLVEVSLREIIDLPETDYVLSMEAFAKVGIDFSKIDAASILTEGNKIKIILPKPRLLSFQISPESLKMEYRNQQNKDLILTAEKEKYIISIAENQLKKKIDSLQLITQAEEKTIRFLSTHFQSLGFTQLSIRFNNTPSNE